CVRDEYGSGLGFW
nr:immunoglobulin heavy chain junction region [Macaca mulatta]MOX60735.1 immunoglobulin heavy chain junction region [Macaca mulatta]MOX61698.1 immunoglobulin heavy chain junction region [Macaca mulatta]